MNFGTSISEKKWGQIMVMAKTGSCVVQTQLVVPHKKRTDASYSCARECRRAPIALDDLSSARSRSGFGLHVSSVNDFRPIEPHESIAWF